MANACGVDFGTSNSTVGWVRPGQSALLALEDGKATLPSVVFFNAEDEEVSYGRAALAGYLAGYEGRLMRSLKSLLGTSLIDGQTEVGGRALPFRMLLSHFIGEVKRRAEREAGRSFNSAVFGRPVFFIDDSTAADRLAEDTLAEVARSVGFEHVAFQYEPIAAAFDYESQIRREELVLIADIGGGTSDFSLVRLSPERALKAERRDDILATGGVHIGGTDFDKYLSLASVMPLLGYQTLLNNNSAIPSSYFFNLATWHTINLAYTKKAAAQLADVARDAREPDKLGRLQRLIEERSGHWLAMQVEEGKIALSDAASATLALDRLSPPVDLLLQRSEFDEAISHLVGSIDQTVLKLLADAGVSPDAVDTVFFTGGSSGVRMLRERIGALVPNALKVEGDLFGSIGAGLALDAVRKFG
ncbi:MULTISPECIES: Hsp70 family protein [Massilia]|uniref:Heat-shock protein n=1 Tax=Massilia violaceinigra TaxID=2045208 RepID=A0A2D2DQU9_9BURK|nr:MULTISPECIES: Hsp70 family protein [Massilia]ATQ77323.1 heat-shock protein [Massilia violaceinigra]MDQ1833370.1 Hsp70 family protein [Massilia sp. CCM 9029]MDQ1922055.1 Hsp70 family protein [Massilia sp. CCM 9206]